MNKYIREITSIILLVIIVALNQLSPYEMINSVFSIALVVLIYITNNHKIFDLYLINKKIISNNMLNVVLNIVYPIVIYLVIYSQITMNRFILFIVIILEIILLSVNLVSLSINKKIKVQYFNQRIKGFFQLLIFVLLFGMLSINNLLVVDFISLILISYAVYLINYLYEMLRK